MQPISKSDLMVQVEQLTIERDGWKDAALQWAAESTLLTAAVQVHREAKKTDLFGAPKRDADEALYVTLDKIEAHREHGPALGAGHGADTASNGGPNGTKDSLCRRLRVLPNFGGSD